MNLDACGPRLGETNWELCDPSNTVTYAHFVSAGKRAGHGKHRLKLPTLGQLLEARFKQRQFLLAPWLREQENCMVYAASGVGKSLFALSAALAVAGGGEFLGWQPEARQGGEGWRVLYVDGEMHIADIQDRARQLRDGIWSLDKAAANQNLRFLARQHQDAGVEFPSITEGAGQAFILEQAKQQNVDLVVLDNFSTLGDVEDENAASSFNAIQQFMLQLKVQGIATMLVHHTGKAEDNFRGSSKLAATFETIIQLERPQLTSKKPGSNSERRAISTTHGEAKFRVRWDKVRAGSRVPLRDVVASLRTQSEEFDSDSGGTWEYETLSLDRLDEIGQLLPAGEFVTQKEIGDYFGVSGTMARRDLDRGITLGMWTEEIISRGLGLGKRKRSDGRSKAPIRPDIAWKNELLDADTSPHDIL